MIMTLCGSVKYTVNIVLFEIYVMLWFIYKYF